MKMFKVLAATSVISLLLSGIASAEGEGSNTLSEKNDNLINTLLQKRALHFIDHINKDQSLTATSDNSISENDDSVILVRISEEAEHLKLTNYSYDYSIANVENGKNLTEVTVDLYQTFEWNNASKPTASHDVVTFEVKDNKIINSDFKKWNINSDDAVKIAKQISSTNRKTFNEKPSKKSLVTVASATNGIYDRNAAANYASTYGAYPNTNWYYFSQSDCTDFASQSLLAGGILKTSTSGGSTNPDAWYYIAASYPIYPPTNSLTWSVADNFFTMLRRNSVVKTTIGYSINDLDLGDIVTYDIDSDNNMNHNAILSSFSYSQDPDTLQWVQTANVSYHSSDRSDVPYSFYAAYTQTHAPYPSVSIKYTHINFSQ